MRALRQLYSLKVIAGIITVTAVGMAGLALLVTTHASTTTASLEVENGSLSSAASTISDTSASGGAAVKFTQALASSAFNVTFDRSAHNCANTPSSCGYPDATNTGVPVGQVLVTPSSSFDCTNGCGAQGHGWRVESNSIRVDTAGAVVSNIKSNYSIYIINAPNTLIKNVQITQSGATDLGVQVRGDSPASNNVTIQDSEFIETQLGSSAAVYDSGTTGLKIIRCEFSGWGGAVQISSYGWSITDSYIHDVALGGVGDAHGNGIQTSGAGGATVVHNTIYNPNPGTDAVMLTNDFGTPQKDDRVENNLLAGGGYTIYAGDTGSGGECGSGCSNIVVKNNRMSRKYFTNSGQFDWISSIPSSGATVTGNFWDNDGALAVIP